MSVQVPVPARPHPSPPVPRRGRASPVPAVLPILCLALALAPARAQDLRSLTVSRQLHGETLLRATIALAAGDLTLQPAATGTLYAVELAWDQARFRPRASYDAPNSLLGVGIERREEGGIQLASTPELDQRAAVGLSPAAELELDVAVRAGNADVELGGLRVRSLRFRAEAGRAVVRWSRPNAGACSRAEFTAEAAELRLQGLGWSGCRALRVRGGVGTITVDLGGDWPADAVLEADVTLGGVRLVVPRRLGVRLSVDRVAATFRPEGFVRQGDAWLSEGYDAATRKVDVRIAAKVGGVEVTRPD